MTDQEKQAAAVAHQRLQMERLRDEFAMAALGAMLANPNKNGTNCGRGGLKTFPGYAYEWADAMLAARQEQPK